MTVAARARPAAPRATRTRAPRADAVGTRAAPARAARATPVRETNTRATPTRATHTRATHADSRAPQVLDAAARLFCRQGYDGTTMREIAAAVGMLPGSLYCHFATKDELLAAVYRRGVERVCETAEAALGRHADPWRRLEAACVAHLEAILRDDDYARVVVRVRPGDVPAAARSMVAQRDRYESLWTGLVDALPLPPRTDRRALRLMLLGALNWSQTWYRPDGTASPRQLARRFVALVRRGLDDTP